MIIMIGIRSAQTEPKRGNAIWATGQNVNALVLDTESHSNTGAQNAKAFWDGRCYLKHVLFGIMMIIRSLRLPHCLFNPFQKPLCPVPVLEHSRIRIQSGMRWHLFTHLAFDAKRQHRTWTNLSMDSKASNRFEKKIKQDTGQSSSTNRVTGHEACKCVEFGTPRQNGGGPLLKLICIYIYIYFFCILCYFIVLMPVFSPLGAPAPSWASAKLERAERSSDRQAVLLQQADEADDVGETWHQGSPCLSRRWQGDRFSFARVEIMLIGFIGKLAGTRDVFKFHNAKEAKVIPNMPCSWVSISVPKCGRLRRVRYGKVM